MSEFKILEDAKKRTRIETGGRCKFCIQVLALPTPKIADFYRAMLDLDITSQTITDVLHRWNVETSKTTVDNHRQAKGHHADHMLTIKKAAKIK